MTPTRPRTLVLVFACFGLAFWLVLRAVYAELPPLPWTAAPSLALLAVLEAGGGRSVRVRLRAQRGEGRRRPGVRPIPPIAVARLAALAKASSLAAAIFGGLAAGEIGRASCRERVFRAV